MNTDNIEKILNELAKDEIPQDVRDIAEQQSRDFEKTLTPAKRTGKIILLESIMKNRITKLAVAAVILIAVLTVSQLGGSGVAWGKLVERIDNVTSFVYHIIIEVEVSESEHVTQMDVLVYYSRDYGSRIENYVQGELNSIILINEAEQTFVTMIPGEKLYIKSPLSQEQINEMVIKQDPRQIIRQMMKTDYVKLGSETIDGVEVESIEATNQTALGGTIKNASARLWVETKRDFPVLLKVDGYGAGGQNKMSMVVKDFQWNKEISPQLFSTDVPSEYTNLETGN